jgi:hypothetical protein
MDEKIFTIDINKCRRNILLNHKYDYCVFNVMDDPKEFNINMEIREGLYYIESDNFFPLRGNGWYYHSLVGHCLDNSVITRNDIKYVIYASSTLKHDHYNGFIEYCNKNILSYQEIQQHYNEKDEEYQDEDGETIDEDFLNLACLKKRATLTDYKKACINSMIGAFKPNLVKHSQWSSTIITSCKLEALRNAIEKDESFIDTFWDNDDNIFYHVLSPHKVSNVETERPLYDQIVQQEIIELHKLKMLVESKGGRITDLNTDAITCTFPGEKCPFNLIDMRRDAPASAQAGACKADEVEVTEDVDISNNKYVFKNQRIHTLAREYLDKEFGGVPSSTFNTTGDYIFHSDFIKSHAFVGWFDKPENVENLKAYDYNKHYSSCLMGQGLKYGWPIYNVFDEVVKFDGKLAPGFFYVETSNFFPFRGNGFYDADLVDYGIESGIITKDNITLQYKSQQFLEPKHFEKFVLSVFEKFKNPKLAINAMIGLFGHDFSNSNTHYFTTEYKYAMMALAQNPEFTVKYVYHEEFHNETLEPININESSIYEFVTDKSPLC